jgi:hypothetical protein
LPQTLFYITFDGDRRYVDEHSAGPILQEILQRIKERQERFESPPQCVVIRVEVATRTVAKD